MVLGDKGAAMEENDITYNATFSMRKSVDPLVEEMKKMLCFLWRQKDYLDISELKQEVNNIMKTNKPHKALSRLALVPRIITKALLQPKPKAHVDQTAALVVYSKVRMFKKNGSDAVTLRSAGESGKFIAAAMHLQRLAFISSRRHDMRFGAEEVDPDCVRSSHAMNLQAPLLRQCREMQRKKPTHIHAWFFENGDISVENFMFKSMYWQRLIPEMLNILKTDILPLRVVGW